jgi:hypothetical protein
MSEITVFTSITGIKDFLVEQQTKGDARFVAYLDKANETLSNDWETREAYDKFYSPRRNSRIHKILAHQYVDTKYSIWIDGNLRLLSTPESLVERYLDGYDLAVFKHPVRSCIYKEAVVCAERGLDDKKILLEQVKKYSTENFAEEKGQAECMMLIRRHTPKVEVFNNYWWSEHCRFSVRDQISFMYAVDKAALRVNFIDEQFKIIQENGKERFIRGDIIEIFPHLTEQKIGN